MWAGRLPVPALNEDYRFRLPPGRGVRYERLASVELRPCALDRERPLNPSAFAIGTPPTLLIDHRTVDGDRRGGMEQRHPIASLSGLGVDTRRTMGICQVLKGSGGRQLLRCILKTMCHLP